MCLVAALVSGCHAVTPERVTKRCSSVSAWLFGHGWRRSHAGQDRADVGGGSTKRFTCRAPQQHGIHFDDLMSSDGVPLDFDAVVRLQVTNR